ncbi:MAG: D-alanyl-D-alanine carboxypeptidase [Clostridiales bacterium]|nr:D-alanyl-D-alanine carboxypeptidase [Clostridiales bacterium]
MLRHTGTNRITKLMVAIISVILILVTTISYIAVFDVFAETEQNPAPKKAPEVSASSYMVMSGSTSEKVASKHPDRKMQPGKVTMLMTAMVVLDNMYDEGELSNTVEITEKLTEYGDTFKLGESVTIGDLLDAMLVGGDVQAAEALARYSASKRSIFINEMNSKCMALGIMDTQFENPSGVYKTTQYSTAADLAVITQAAMRYQVIKDALNKKSVTVQATVKKQSRDIEFSSTNPLLTGEGKTSYEYIKGGMLGTIEAPGTGAQFAAVATKDDMQLIVVLMDSEPDKAAAEAKELLEYGDLKVTKNTIVKKNKLCGYARVRGGASTRVAAYTETKGFAYVPPEGSDELIQTQVVMFSDLEAPLEKGDKVGEFRIFVADELKGTVDLIIKQDVPVGWAPSKYYISNKAAVVLGVVLAMLLMLLLRIWHVKRVRAKRRAAMRRAKIRELARRQMEIDRDRVAREWNSSGYDPMPPRTTDIRREAVKAALEKDKKKRRRRKKQ